MGFLSNPSPILGNDPNDLPRKVEVDASGYVKNSITDSAIAVPVDVQFSSLPDSNPVPTKLIGSLANVQGSKNVTTAGTRVQLHADQACREVLIKAKRVNTGYIYIGTNVVSSSTFGIDLAANESISLQVANLNQIYLDSSVSGEGVTYIAI